MHGEYENSELVGLQHREQTTQQNMVQNEGRAKREVMTIIEVKEGTAGQC